MEAHLEIKGGNAFLTFSEPKFLDCIILLLA